jgi:hypothetical protein
MRLFCGFGPLRFVVTDHTADGRADQAMMTCDMAGNATHDRSLDAALGISGKARYRKRHGEHRTSDKHFHQQ